MLRQGSAFFILIHLRALLSGEQFRLVFCFNLRGLDFQSFIFVEERTISFYLFRNTAAYHNDHIVFCIHHINPGIAAEQY